VLHDLGARAEVDVEVTMRPDAVDRDRLLSGSLLGMNESLQNELETWLGMWHKQIVSAGDVAIAAERLFARGLPPEQFHSLPETVRRQVLHDLDVYAVEGPPSLVAAHSSSEPIDESETMR